MGKKTTRTVFGNGICEIRMSAPSSNGQSSMVLVEGWRDGKPLREVKIVMSDWELEYICEKIQEYATAKVALVSKFAERVGAK